MSGIVSKSPDNNSGIVGVFPAGHLIQRKSSRHKPADHNYLTSGTSWVSHGDEADFKFDFTPKSAGSTIFLEYYYGLVHVSTGGGYGWYAFTRDGARNDWGGGITGYADGDGHFASGHNNEPNLYHAIYGLLQYQNNSTTAFEIGLDVKRGAGQWYYSLDGHYNILSISEYVGSQIVTSGAG